MVAKGKDGGRDHYRVWDEHVHTAIFKMDNQQGPTVLHRELCLVLSGSLHRRGVCREWIYGYILLSRSAVLLKLSQLCLLTVLQYEIKN